MSSTWNFENQNLLQSDFDSILNNDSESEDLPLLEELEIYPGRILHKVRSVLHPFRKFNFSDDEEYLTRDPDLSGPLLFFFVLVVSLFLTGNKASVSYIYVTSIISWLSMYCLMNLMTLDCNLFSLITVASILGYSLIPVACLSVFGVIYNLQTPIGAVLAALVVFWSSVSASKLFVTVSGDQKQLLLVTYPCVLVSGILVLLVVF